MPDTTTPSARSSRWAWRVWLGTPAVVAVIAAVGIFLLAPYVDSGRLLLVRGHEAATVTAWLWLAICGCAGVVCMVLAVRVSMNHPFRIGVLAWLATGVVLLVLLCVVFYAWLMWVGSSMSSYVPLDQLARPPGEQLLVEERRSLHGHMTYGVWRGGPDVYYRADVPGLLDVRTRHERPMAEGDFRVETTDDGSAVLVLLDHRIALP